MGLHGEQSQANLCAMMRKTARFNIKKSYPHMPDFVVRARDIQLPKSGCYKLNFFILRIFYSFITLPQM